MVFPKNYSKLEKHIPVRVFTKICMMGLDFQCVEEKNDGLFNQYSSLITIESDWMHHFHS